MEEDFERELLTTRHSKISLGKYLKNTEKKLDKPVAEEDETKTDDKDTDKKKENEVIQDQTISRNPKINVYLATGFGAQIKNNPHLLEFKLIYYRLHSYAWKTIGNALGRTKTL